MRAVRDIIQPVIERCVYDQRFGGRRERSAAMATLTLQKPLSQNLSKMDHTYALFLDITNAVSSVPVHLVLDSLRKIGIDEKVVQPIGNTVFNSEFTVKMGHNKYYHPLCGVKQGCPVAALCFILLYQILVNVLKKNEIDAVSFVDDAMIVIHDRTSPNMPSTCLALPCNEWACK